MARAPTVQYRAVSVSALVPGQEWAAGGTCPSERWAVDAPHGETPALSAAALPLRQTEQPSAGCVCYQQAPEEDSSAFTPLSAQQEEKRAQTFAR